MEFIGAQKMPTKQWNRYSISEKSIWETGIDNAERILAALAEFGIGSLNLGIEDFSSQGNIIQLGYEPFRIDIITQFIRHRLCR